VRLFGPPPPRPPPRDDSGGKCAPAAKKWIRTRAADEKWEATR
jgi:hypothetical protein